VNTLCATVAQSLVVALAFGPVACGGGEVTPIAPHDDNRVMSPDFNGHWSGDAVLIVSGGDRGVQHATVDASTDEETVTLDVTGLCLGQHMRLVAKGNGRSTMWYGSETCALTIDECEVAAVTYTSAILDLRPDGRLYIRMFGVASGCGISPEISVEVYSDRM
jgi:hypothetical protein